MIIAVNHLLVIYFHFKSVKYALFNHSSLVLFNDYFSFQLMRQIDLMVTAKKAEWENHMHTCQIQLDKKTKELEFVKDQLDQKCQEV